MARKRKIAAILFSLGCLQAGSVWALGLGEMSLESFLNEPLKAKVNLLNTGDLHEDQIKVRLATKEDFSRLGVERAYFLTGIKFEVRVGENGRGEIVLTSDDPVLEPYLDLIIETRWPSGRLLREYTVLVDPPSFDTSTPVVSASERVREVEGGTPPDAKKNTEPAATSGTRVGVGEKSDLAPGEMPERDYSAGTAGAPAPGSRYMVRRDETLWRIAEAATPAGASVYQTMLDIQRLNPDAFIDGNINKIKAGYILYLPAEGDISSSDLEQALAEVRQQNEDWRAGRTSTPYGEDGPSLRISAGDDDAAADDADSGEAPDSSAAGRTADGAAEGQPGASEAGEALEVSRRENGELQQRVDTLSEQVETLESIVSVKDQQIAALQQALEEAGTGSGSSSGGSASPSSEPTSDPSSDPSARPGDTTAANDSAAGAAGQDPAEEAPEPAASQPEPKPAARPAPKAAPEPESSWTDNLLWPGVALLALLGGLLWWRRRQADEEDSVEDDEPDIFAGVELRDQDLQVADDGDPIEPPAPAPVAEPAPEPRSESEPEPEPVPGTGRADSRGYGDHGHDTYASDVDSGDALAEADIYIAYGRYPQAIELLNNALAVDPGNSAYRLKLIELYGQSGHDAEAEEQLLHLREVGDVAAASRGEDILADLRGGDNGASPASPGADDDEELTLLSTPTVGNPAGARGFADVSPDDLEAAPEFDEREGGLGHGFTELEIEDDSFGDLDGELDGELGADLGGDLGDDLDTEFDGELDLSDDFADEDSTEDDDDDDELVFATEGNPMSTKLDLARAYIDMGDEEGARQILEEVVIEGSGEQQREAQALLERIG